MNLFKARPALDYKLLGTSVKLDSRRFYDACDASNQPDWEKRGAIFILENGPGEGASIGVLLERGEYERRNTVIKPTRNDCEGKSVGDIMARFFPDMKSFDYALPQPWVDYCIDQGFDPSGKCVWSYEGPLTFGAPFFLTQAWEIEYANVCPEAMSAV